MSPEARELLERMERLRKAGDIALANADASNERIIALLIERGAPAESVAKIKAAMEGRSLHVRSKKLTDFRRAEIARLNAAGLHDGAIACTLGISRPHVCQVRNALGIPPVNRRP